MSGPAVFLELSCLRNKAICNAFNLSFSARLARHSCVINALVEPRVEDLKLLIGVEGLLHILVVGRKSPGQYPGVVAIDIYEEGQWCGAGVSFERMLEGGGGVCVPKVRIELFVEGNIHFTRLVILLTLSHVLLGELLLVKGVSPCWDGECLTGFGLSDGRDLSDEHVLCRRQEEYKVDVLAHSMGNLY